MRQIKTVWQAWGLSLALGMAILGMGFGLAHAESQLAQQSSAPNEFVCHAKPGNWCDLRDWGAPVVGSLPTLAVEQ
jgi:hypothetical protein